MDGTKLLVAPPISILLSHELVELLVVKSDRASSKISYVDQSLFSMACAASEGGLSLVPFDVITKLDNPTAIPDRVSFSLTEFKSTLDAEANGGMNGKPAKRLNRLVNEDVCLWGLCDVMGEVSRLAELLIAVIDDDAY